MIGGPADGSIEVLAPEIAEPKVVLIGTWSNDDRSYAFEAYERLKD